MMLATLALTGCTDFLTKEPETDLAPGTFFASEAELELWTNGFYSMFNGPDDDALAVSDIHIARTLNNVQQGTRSAATESWSWGGLRKINYFLEHSSNCTDENIRARFDGVAYFFRGMFYFQRVRRYGDVPYYDYVISDTDWGSLRKPRDSRGYVMQRVMEDFDRAIEMLPDAWPSEPLYHVSKDAARAMKARAAIYEGTFRKYHGIPDEEYDGGLLLSADYFLQQAADAARQVIGTGRYALYKDNPNKLGPYREFFCLEDANAKETILAMRFNKDVLVRHGVQFTYRNQRHSMTRPFTYHYLMADGSRVQDQPGWETMLYAEQFKERDPRMAQTLMAPGYVALNAKSETLEDLKTYDRTGYRIIKFISDETHDSASSSTTDWSILRYPEVLLIYAEAQAELGLLTADDVVATIDVIRDRVGMPRLDMARANADPDPWLASYYPHVPEGPNKGVILEIRRERTIELCCEGQRQWDMFRWKEGCQLSPASNTEGGYIGCYFPSLGEYDMNGDGKPDLCLWSGKKPSTSCENLLEVGEGKDVELSNGDSGYVICFGSQTYKWNEDRDYLWPIPADQRIATQGALTQNPGYEDGLTFE